MATNRRKERMKSIKLKGLWCLITKDQDGEVEVCHIKSDRKPSVKKALMIAYDFDEDDEALKIMQEEFYIKIEPVTFVIKLADSL